MTPADGPAKERLPGRAWVSSMPTDTPSTAIDGSGVAMAFGVYRARQSGVDGYGIGA